MSYLLFVGEDYYPGGGMRDLDSIHEDLESLITKLDSLYITKTGTKEFRKERIEFIRTYGPEWFHVFNTKNLEIIEIDFQNKNEYYEKHFPKTEQEIDEWDDKDPKSLKNILKGNIKIRLSE